MKNTNRRFVFTDYENLLHVKFRKLEKVCDRLFIFISEDQESISFSLARQIQSLGKSAKWIMIGEKDKAESFNYPMAFLMGRMHQKMSPEIEFAILSNDTNFDPLVNYINEKGRDCLRIQRNKSPEPKMSSDAPMVIEELGADSAGEESDDSIEITFEGESLIRDTAKETVRRLVHSGNRPAEIETLKRYIQLYNQELTEYDGNVELIIRKMEDNKEIEIQKGVVKYNF